MRVREKRFEIGCDYYTITIDDYGIGIDTKSYWGDNDFHKRLKIGNVFKSERKAKTILSKIKKLLKEKSNARMS